MEKPEPVFIDGMMFELPNQNAPEWVKGKIHVKAKNFFEFAKKHVNERGWLNIDLKKSQKGTYYLQLNTFESNGKKLSGDDWKKVNEYREESNNRIKEQFPEVDPAVEMSGEGGIDADSIPF
jgi:hypothetical protein